MDNKLEYFIDTYQSSKLSFNGGIRQGYTATLDSGSGDGDGFGFFEMYFDKSCNYSRGVGYDD